MVTFVLGGFTGIILAMPPLDYHGPQYGVPGRAFPQHADPRAALRHARGLPLLVSEGVRLSAERAMGPHRLRLLGGRLLPRLHAALCPGRRRHGAAHAGDLRAGVPALAAMSPAAARWCCCAPSARCSCSSGSASASATQTACLPAIRGTGAASNGRSPRRRRNITSRSFRRSHGRDPFFDAKRKGDRLCAARITTRTSRCRSNSMTGLVIGVARRGVGVRARLAHLVARRPRPAGGQCRRDRAQLLPRRPPRSSPPTRSSGPKALAARRGGRRRRSRARRRRHAAQPGPGARLRG